VRSKASLVYRTTQKKKKKITKNEKSLYIQKCGKMVEKVA